MRLNKEQLIEFCKDKEIKIVLHAPTFVQVRGVHVPTTMLLPNDYVDSWVSMVCNYMVNDGVPWQQILFDVSPSGNCIFLNLNSPTKTH